jgi:hypothetical protein
MLCRHRNAAHDSIAAMLELRSWPPPGIGTGADTIAQLARRPDR